MFGNSFKPQVNNVQIQVEVDKFCSCNSYRLRPGSLLPFMLISLKVTVQDCQAVPFDDGNGTLAEKEVFEKFYNCYFGKYFADSDSVQKYVNQRVEYSMDFQEKVESRGVPKTHFQSFHSTLKFGAGSTSTFPLSIQCGRSCSELPRAVESLKVHVLGHPVASFRLRYLS